MKNLFHFMLGLVAAAGVSLWAQPQGFNYQALVRDNTGAAVKSHAVGVRIQIHQDSASGSQVYSETFAPTSNAYGNINLVIGRGSNVTGTFSALNWSKSMFLEVDLDVTGGTNYVTAGTVQLMSVPYALYSGKSVQTPQILSESSDTLYLSNGGGSAILPSAQPQSQIHDAANKTSVQTEKNPGENVIRFTIDSTEKMRLQGSRLEFVNNGGSVFLGDSAGLHDDLNNRQNVFVGYQAGTANTTGGNNTFTGANAGAKNTTGQYNTFTGGGAGTSNAIGSNNTFSGLDAGFSNSDGDSNTYVGAHAGYTNNHGSRNAFFGTQAGDNNSTGYYNLFAGINAGYVNDTGSFNTFVGAGAGYFNKDGGSDAFLGMDAGKFNTSGDSNTFLGAFSGPASGSTGQDSGNVFIGNNVGLTGSNLLAIDNKRTASPLIWGDFSTDSVQINGGLAVTRGISANGVYYSSDRRLKEDIQPLPNALDGVDKLNGVYYRFKAKAPDGKSYPQTRQIGVIAQDVQKVYPELVSVQPSGYLAVDYPKLTAVLIEAVKELQQQNRDLQARMQKVEGALRLSQLKTAGDSKLATAGR